VTILVPLARAASMSEYELKAGFLYNFAVFTEWPSDIGPTLKLCVYGKDPFAEHMNGLQGKAVGDRHIVIAKGVELETLATCQLVFVSNAAIGDLPRVLDHLKGLPVLTVADTQGAGAHGIILNMTLTEERVRFEANLSSAHSARLSLSSKLLRLATEVRH
jgi:hypothetical protein